MVVGAALVAAAGAASFAGSQVNVQFTGVLAAQAQAASFSGTGAITSAAPSPLLLPPLNAATFGNRDVDADVVTMFAEIPSGAPAVTRVDFLVGASIVGTANAAPWQYQWATTQGSYAVKARVTYADTSTGDSAVANITVAAPSSAPLPTATAQVKAWADFGHANTLNPGGTQAALGDQVASFGRFVDGTIVTSQFVQATTTKRCRLALWRGKKVLETCTNTTATENYAAALSGSQGFPSTLMPTYRGVGAQAAGVQCGHSGVSNIEERGTAWPRTNRCLTSVVVDDAIAQPTGICTRFVMNNTNSQVWRQGIAIHNPVASGTTGLSTSITFPGHTGGSAEPGYAADYVYAQGTVGGTDATNLDAYQVAKFDLTSPEYRILHVGDSNGRIFGLTDGGWRKLLHDFCHQGKICGGWIEEIGLKLEGGVRYFGGDVHDCVDSKGIAYHSSAVSGSGLPSLLGAGLQWQPNIVTIEIGVNNAASTSPETYVAGNAAGSTRQAWRDLVTIILNAMPSPGQLVVTNLFPDQISGVNTNIIALNANWFQDAIDAAAALGRTVVCVDVNTPLGGPTWVSANYQPDGHYNSAGYTIHYKALLAGIVKAAYKLANAIA